MGDFEAAENNASTASSPVGLPGDGVGSISEGSPCDGEKRQSIKLRLSNRIKSIKETLLLAEDAFSPPVSRSSHTQEDGATEVALALPSTDGQKELVDEDFSKMNIIAVDGDSNIDINVLPDVDRDTDLTATVTAEDTISIKAPDRSSGSSSSSSSTSRRGSKLVSMYEQRLEEQRLEREREREGKRQSAQKDALREIGRE